MKKCILVSVFFFLPIIASASVIITEVMCNPVGSDTNGEWVKIKNTGSEQIDITGWKFNDGANHKLNIPPKNGGSGDMILGAGEVVLLANKADQVSGGSAIIDTVMSLNNSADTLSLISQDGTTEDVYSYTVLESASEGDLCLKSTSTSDDIVIATTPESQSNIVTITNEVTKYNTVTIQPPEDVHIRTKETVEGVVGGDIEFVAEVYNAKGNSVSDAKCTWVFGDGVTSDGCKNAHRYEYSGEYRARVYVEYKGLTDDSIVGISVYAPALNVFLDTENKFIEIKNNDTRDIQFNNWVIKRGYKRVTIPSGTIIPAGVGVKFSIKTLGLDIRQDDAEVILYDSRGSVVAVGEYLDNNIAIESTIEDEEAELQSQPAEEKQTTDFIVKSPALSVPQASVSTTNKKVAMGTIVPSGNKQHLNGVAQIKIKEDVTLSTITNKHAGQQVAGVGMVTEFGNIFDSKKISWILALLAVIFLASIGIIFSDSSAEDEIGTDTIDSELVESRDESISADEFTIIENKDN